MSIETDLQVLKQSMLQIVSLSEIYDDIVKDGKKAPDDQKRLEAEYARDQILKLSVHVRHLLLEIERREPI